MKEIIVHLASKMKARQGSITCAMYTIYFIVTKIMVIQCTFKILEIQLREFLAGEQTYRV